jgi:hypothetical protein
MSRDSGAYEKNRKRIRCDNRLSPVGRRIKPHTLGTARLAMIRTQIVGRAAFTR